MALQKENAILFHHSDRRIIWRWSHVHF